MAKDSLPHLETFAEAAERGSFTAAARALHITQAAVSQRIGQLERQVNAALFRREGGRVSLTEAGRTLHRFARRILQLHRDARIEIEGVQPGVAGELLLGASTIPGNHLLPAILAEFRRKHPKVRVRVEGGDTASVLRLIDRGKIQVGLVGGRTDSPHLEFEEFARDQLVVIVRPDHRWGRRRRISLAELARQPLVLRESGSGSRGYLEHAIATSDRPIDLKIALELGGNEAVKQAVAEGIGAAVVSELAIREDLKAGRFHALELVGLPLERPMFVVVDRRRALGPPALAFLAHLGKGRVDH